MPQNLSLLKMLLQQTLNLFPKSFFARIEDLAQKQLGKGSGAWSTAKEAELIANFARKIGLNEVFAIDAGANRGDWSASFLDCLPNARILAFEPSQHAFEILQQRFLIDDRVLCSRIALGKVNSTTNLYSDTGGSGLGSLTKRRVEHFNIEFNHVEEVEVQTLDSWIRILNDVAKPNILKMDVEGHEFDVLEGASETLKGINIIQFEFGGSNIDTRTFFQDFWYFFQKLGFEIYRLTPSNPILLKNYSESDETFKATNYVAVRSHV